MVSMLSTSLLAWSRLAWDLFLRAVVISSNELMIINSGLLFLTAHLAITPGCISIMILLQVPKAKEREEKRRRLLVLGINVLVFFYSFL
jgi:hypothetical protein